MLARSSFVRELTEIIQEAFDPSQGRTQMSIEQAAEPRPAVKLVAIAVIAIFSALLLEVGTRIVFAVQSGLHILSYGLTSSTETNVHIHENVIVGQYSKYRPHDVRRDREGGTGRFIDVRINSHGFRAPEYAIDKAPGTYRIVALGASSTFGYHSPDDETYPQHLQRELVKRCPKIAIEVINLGIPHLDSEQISTLFVAEGIPLKPDMVTFYEGSNDAQGGVWRVPEVPSLRRQVTTFLRDHLLIAHLVSQLGRRRDMLDEASVVAFAKGKPEKFIANLEQIWKIAIERNITFVAITQQANGGRAVGIAYEDEVGLIRAELAKGKKVNSGEATLLAHHQIMNQLRAWVGGKDVPLVDGIRALDSHRDLMTSWVHLSGRANAILAMAIADGIASHVCPLSVK